MRTETEITINDTRDFSIGKQLTNLPVHDRILPTGVADLAAAGPASGPLEAAATAYRKAIDTLTTTTQFAA